jgi:hypothetical protein
MRMSFDNSVVDEQHVVWQRLTADARADLLENFPLRPDDIPFPTDPDVFGADVDPRFEKWLDSAYLMRHAFDSLNDDSVFG